MLSSLSVVYSFWSFVSLIKQQQQQQPSFHCHKSVIHLSLSYYMCCTTLNQTLNYIISIPRHAEMSLPFLFKILCRQTYLSLLRLILSGSVKMCLQTLDRDNLFMTYFTQIHSRKVGFSRTISKFPEVSVSWQKFSHIE